MTEVDRRTILRGALFGVAFITAGGTAITTVPQPAAAVPLAKPEAVPNAKEEHKTGPVETDDVLEGQDRVELVQYWRRRRRWWRRRHIWWHRRRRWRRRYWW